MRCLMRCKAIELMGWNSNLINSFEDVCILRNDFHIFIDLLKSIWKKLLFDLATAIKSPRMSGERDHIHILYCFAHEAKWLKLTWVCVEKLTETYIIVRVWKLIHTNSYQAYAYGWFYLHYICARVTAK